MGRTEKSIRNTIYSVLDSAVGVLSMILTRMVFLRALNTEFLGVNTLFAEILSVLSITDLGMGSVMLYTYFEPLAKHDEHRLGALTKFYRKIYLCIAAAVAVIGVVLVPFVPSLVNLDRSMPNLYTYYLIFLANTVVSYLFVYKTTILSADQNSYVLAKISLIAKIVLTGAQISILLLTGNNILYLLAALVCTILVNLTQSFYANKMYPFLKEKERDNLAPEERTEIVKSIRDGFIYKLSGIFMNSTDNTLISVLISTATVGMFNNYSYITTQIGKVSSLLFGGMVGSVGNLIATEEPKKRRDIFWVLHSVSSIIGQVAIVCVAILLSDTVRVWLGEEYVLKRTVVYALCCNVYFSISLMPLWLYRDATAMFRKIKYVMLLCGVINLVLSIVTGLKWGLAGIILSSAISRFLTYFWYEPFLLFRDFFDATPTKYYVSHGLNVLGIVLGVVMCNRFFGEMVPGNWGDLLVKAIGVFFTTLAIFVAYNITQKSFRDALRYIKDSLGTRLLNRLKKVNKNE